MLCGAAAYLRARGARVRAQPVAHGAEAAVLRARDARVGVRARQVQDGGAQRAAHLRTASYTPARANLARPKRNRRQTFGFERCSLDRFDFVSSIF